MSINISFDNITYIRYYSLDKLIKIQEYDDIISLCFHGKYNLDKLLKFPDKLRSLTCDGGCKATKLPEFPSGLVQLFCNIHGLLELPELPFNLRKLLMLEAE